MTSFKCSFCLQKLKNNNGLTNYWKCVSHWRCLLYVCCVWFLGQLLRVDLIKWVSNVCLLVRMSVHLQKVSSISMKFHTYVEVNEWCMTVCSMTRSKVKVTSSWKLEIQPFSTAMSSPIYNGGCQMTSTQILKLGHTAYQGQIFNFCLSSCVTWRQSLIIYYENRTQSTSKKKTNTDRKKKKQKYRHTHIKKNEEINPKDESRNQPMHRAVIKRDIVGTEHISTKFRFISKQ